MAVNVFWRELEAQFYDPRDPYGNKAEWRPLIGRGPSRYCALIGWDHGVATPALSWSLSSRESLHVSSVSGGVREDNRGVRLLDYHGKPHRISPANLPTINNLQWYISFILHFISPPISPQPKQNTVSSSYFPPKPATKIVPIRRCSGGNDDLSLIIKLTISADRRKRCWAFQNQTWLIIKWHFVIIDDKTKNSNYSGGRKSVWMWTLTKLWKVLHYFVAILYSSHWCELRWQQLFISYCTLLLFKANYQWEWPLKYNKDQQSTLRFLPGSHC